MVQAGWLERRLSVCSVTVRVGGVLCLLVCLYDMCSEDWAVRLFGLVVCLWLEELQTARQKRVGAEVDKGGSGR